MNDRLYQALYELLGQYRIEDVHDIAPDDRAAVMNAYSLDEPTDGLIDAMVEAMAADGGKATLAVFAYLRGETGAEDALRIIQAALWPEIKRTVDEVLRDVRGDCEGVPRDPVARIRHNREMLAAQLAGVD